MSEAAIAKKGTLAQVVAEKFESAISVIIVDYRGLAVEEATNLRRQLRDVDVEMKVIRSLTLSRAAKRVDLDGLDGVSAGPTAVAFNNDDIVAPAGIINGFTKDVETLEIRDSVIKGEVSSMEQIIALTKPLNREGLLSMLLSILQVPVRNVAYIVKAVVERNGEVT